MKKVKIELLGGGSIEVEEPTVPTSGLNEKKADLSESIELLGQYNEGSDKSHPVPLCVCLNSRKLLYEYLWQTENDFLHAPPEDGEEGKSLMQKAAAAMEKYVAQLKSIGDKERAFVCIEYINSIHKHISLLSALYEQGLDFVHDKMRKQAVDDFVTSND